MVSSLQSLNRIYSTHLVASERPAENLQLLGWAAADFFIFHFLLVFITMIRRKSSPSLLGLFLLLISYSTSTLVAASPAKRHRHLDSDNITNGSLDMRLTARVDIPKFYVVLSPTDREFDDDENVIILQSTEEMLDWSFQTATEYEDGTSFDSLHLLGIKSWFVPGGEEGSRKMRRRSLAGTPTDKRESNDFGKSEDGSGAEDDDKDDVLISSMPSHTILEIEGGTAEFLVPASGKIPTTSMVASIIKDSIENDMLSGLQMPTMGGRNQVGGGPTADFSSISSVKYIESIQGTKEAGKDADNESTLTIKDIPTADAFVSAEESGSVPTEYSFTTILVGIAVGGAMTVFVVAALVAKLRKEKSPEEHAFYSEDAETDSDLRTDNTCVDSKNVSMDFSHVITSEQVPPSPLNDFIARTSPSPKRKDKKSPVREGTPDAVILDDGLSIVSTENSMECQLSIPSTASVCSNLESVTQNLNQTRFSDGSSGGGGGSSSTSRKKRKKSNLPPLDENAPYSVENYMVTQDLALSSSLSKDATFDTDAHWDPNDNDAGSVSSIDGSGFEEI